MFVVNLLFVSSTPADAGYDFHTADETKEEAAQPATLGFVLRKVFASPSMWLIAVSSMCIGMVRNSIDQFWAGYFGDDVPRLDGTERPSSCPTASSPTARRRRRSPAGSSPAT